MSVLVAVCCGGEKVLTEVYMVAVDRSNHEVVGEKHVAIKNGDIATGFDEMVEFSSNWNKVGIVCDGPRLFRKELPKIKDKTLEGCWTKYFDVTRETEKVFENRCSGFLAVMLTVGLEPEIPQTTKDKSITVSKVLVKLLEAEHDFRRPMMAHPTKDKKEKKTKVKRKRSAKEDEDEMVQEQEAPAPTKPTEPPTLKLLRDTLFMFATTAELAEGERDTCADELLSAIKSTKSKSSRNLKIIRPQTGYNSCNEWLCVLVSYAVAKFDEKIIISLPDVSSSIEVAAALSDNGCASDLFMFLGESPLLSAPTKRILITTHELSALLIRGMKADHPYRHNVVVSSTACPIEHALKVSQSLGHNSTVVGFCDDGSVGTTDCQLSTITFPCVDEATSALRDDELLGSWSVKKPTIAQAAITALTTNDVSAVAGAIKTLHDQKTSTFATTSVWGFCLLAIYQGTLLEYHQIIMRFLMNLDFLVPEGHPSGYEQKLIPEAVRSVLSLPLLSLKDFTKEVSESDKRTIKNIDACPLAVAVTSALKQQLADAAVDNLCDLWCVDTLYAVPASQAVHAVKHGKKQGKHLAAIEASLMGLLKSEQLGVSLSTLEQGLCWGMLKKFYGPFHRFLHRCKTNFVVERSAADSSQLTASVLQGSVPLSTIAIPLSGRKTEEAAKMAKSAIEELLNILPRGTKKTLLSSVGVSIQSWNRFNNRHQGLLGPSLHTFVLRYPEHFTSVGRSLWRTDPKSSPSYDTGLLRHGGREHDEVDDGVRNQKKRKKGSRKERIHQVIADKFNRKQARKNSLRSAKIQKIPGFGKKKLKFHGRGTKPHYMK
eukprot:TRINITY_DN14105_c2_g1_i2.p1 TRINITY_DN14105_c2_g1~~TRINITY_DN14105_c2_g1_i2.p1  ORF type:complete len:837 (+),score=159.65 TRINITY_DN14105_c2_g1_i2:35-2512(+)